MSVAQKVLDLFPENPTVAVVAYDDSRAGPDPAAATLGIRSPRAFQRVVTRPGELGFARAYVAGDIVIDGDIYAALEAAIGQPDAQLDLLEFLRLAWHEAGPSMFSSPPPATRGGQPAGPPPRPAARLGGHLSPLRRLQRASTSSSSARR